MIRILGYLIAVGLFIAGAVWMADHPGMVTIRWMDWRLDTSVPILVLALGLLLIVGYFALRFVFGILGLPSWISRRSRERRQVKGSAALTGAITAIAAGDTEAAKRCMKNTDKTLKNPQLTHLLTAQIDAESGNKDAAKGHYLALLDTPETELAGLRGLVETLGPQDAEALKYAEKAVAKAPKAAWAIKALFAAQMAAGRIDAAYNTMVGAKKKAVFTAQEQADLAMARAEQAQAEGRMVDAGKLAREAVDLVPDNPAATMTLAAVYRADNKQKKAAEVLESQWQKTPSPQLVTTYLTMWAATEPKDRLKYVQALVNKNFDHPESRLALAEAQLDMGQFGDARETLTPVLGPDVQATYAARAALTMARILGAEGADNATQKEWVERAATGLASA